MKALHMYKDPLSLNSFFKLSVTIIQPLLLILTSLIFGSLYILDINFMSVKYLFQSVA